jgi:hypothetical protein
MQQAKNSVTSERMKRVLEANYRAGYSMIRITSDVLQHTLRVYVETHHQISITTSSDAVN